MDNMASSGIVISSQSKGSTMTIRVLIRRLSTKAGLALLLFAIWQFFGLASDFLFVGGLWITYRSIKDLLSFFEVREMKRNEFRSKAILAAISTADEQRMYVEELGEKLAVQNIMRRRRVLNMLFHLEDEKFVQVYDDTSNPKLKCVSISPAGRARLEKVSKSVTQHNPHNACG
jgi:DNA-binding MarR family transcriptional regulator